MFRNFYLILFLILISLNFSCQYIKLSSKTAQEAQEPVTNSEKNIGKLDEFIDEPNKNNEVIELSQEFYHNAIYKMDNDDLSGAITDFDTALHMLKGCDLSEDQKKVADEIIEDIFNQLVTIISDKNKDWENSTDVKPDDFQTFSQNEDGSDIFNSDQFSANILGIDDSFDLPVDVNHTVLYFLSHYSMEFQSSFQKAIERSAIYLPHIKEIFKEKELPLDLSYLPLIESAFKVKALSRARASGLWQFMSWTGRKYGLKRNSFIDERYDPFKSTVAACNYLKDLYALFNDWYLALASYNLGENKILYASKKTGITNFWELSKTRYIPRETREFVPRFLAALIIAKNPEKFGIKKPESRPLQFDTIEVKKPVSLHLMAKHCKTSLKELKSLNPELRTSSTPPNIDSYILRIPEGKKDIFLAKYQELESRGLLSEYKHHVRRGETLSSIAQRYKVPISSLIEANSIKNPHRIKVNSYLRIPSYSGEYKYKTQKPLSSKIENSNTDFIDYKIKPGDTIYDIAIAFNSNVSSIKHFNNIRYNNIIYPGKILKIPTNPKSESKSDKSIKTVDGVSSEFKEDVIVYVIESGDTMYEIAKKFNCSVNDIKRWNSIANKRYIYPGDKLYIHKISHQ